jgi:hypothetical protein
LGEASFHGNANPLGNSRVGCVLGDEERRHDPGESKSENRE